MEIKANEATPNRPAGDRILDAPYVYANLPSFIKQVKVEPSWEKNDRNAITVFKSAQMTIVVSALKEEASLKECKVDGYVTIQVLEGAIKLITQDGDGDMGENHLMVFHPGILHSIEARLDTVLLITTYALKH